MFIGIRLSDAGVKIGRRSENAGFRNLMSQFFILIRVSKLGVMDETAANYATRCDNGGSFPDSAGGFSRFGESVREIAQRHADRESLGGLDRPSRFWQNLIHSRAEQPSDVSQRA